MGLIFRNDDVSFNTDFNELKQIYDLIYKKFPNVRIISGITVLCKTNIRGSVYPTTPFKDKSIEDLCKIDNVIESWDCGDIASHGLLHLDHSKLSEDAQKISILTSCNFLRTKIFIPPFNRFNEDTIKICKDNDIWLVGHNEKWLSLEHNKMDDNHRHWYFHSWRYTTEELNRELAEYSRHLG